MYASYAYDKKWQGWLQMGDDRKDVCLRLGQHDGSRCRAPTGNAAGSDGEQVEKVKACLNEDACMNGHERIFAYKKESVQGLLDRLAPRTRIRVRIPGRNASEMTVAELSRQIEALRREDVGERAIERIEVEVVR